MIFFLDVIKKQQGVKMVCHLLKDLACYSTSARVLALREILGNSINNEQAKYFGAKEKFEPRFEEMLLLHQNHRQVKLIFKKIMIKVHFKISKICFNICKIF